MTTSVIEIQDAIERSITHDMIVPVTATIDDVLVVADELGYEVDSVEVSDGNYHDVWGWSDEAEPAKQEWRLRVRRH